MRLIPRWFVRLLLRFSLRRARRSATLRAEIERAVMVGLLSEAEFQDIGTITWDWNVEPWRGPVVTIDGQQIDTTEMLYSDDWRHQ